MHVRVELAVGLDGRETLALEQLLELAVDELDALLELRLFVLLGRLDRPLQVVEDRQELLHDPLAGPRDQGFLVARGPLAVVVEVGLDALERVDQLLVLVPERLELDDLRRGLLLVLDFLRHGVPLGRVPGTVPVKELRRNYAFLASSSSSMTS